MFIAVLLGWIGSIIGSSVLVWYKFTLGYGLLMFFGNIIATYVLALLVAPEGTNEGSWIGLLAVPIIAVLNTICIAILLTI